MTSMMHKGFSNKGQRKLILYQYSSIFWFLVFLHKDLLYDKNLESPAKYRQNSNNIAAYVCVLIIKGENEKDAEKLLEDNNWMFSLKAQNN